MKTIKPLIIKTKQSNSCAIRERLMKAGIAIFLCKPDCWVLVDISRCIWHFKAHRSLSSLLIILLLSTHRLISDICKLTLLNILEPMLTRPLQFTSAAYIMHMFVVFLPVNQQRQYLYIYIYKVEEVFYLRTRSKVYNGSSHYWSWLHVLYGKCTVKCVTLNSVPVLFGWELP